MEIRTLENIEFKTIHKAFQEAFIDYELPPMSENDLLQMLTRRGFRPDISLGAFNGDEIVSFTFNGYGLWNGLQTSYDTGTGTIKDFRGKGLAKQIFNASVPVLKKAGVKQYLLEVLQHNDKAVPLYKSVGFEVTREFDYYVSDKKDIKIPAKDFSENILIKKIELKDIENTQSIWEFNPSWQNSLNSIRRGLPHFEIYGAYISETLVGYGVTELNTGDITLIAVNKDHRRKGVGTKIMQHLVQQVPGDSVKVINTDRNNKIMKGFLKSLNMIPLGQQYEMIKKI